MGIDAANRRRRVSQLSRVKPRDIYYTLNRLNNPLYIFKVKNGRIGIVPEYISSFNVPLMVVMEIGSGLASDFSANINKIITIYPKSDLDEYVTNLDQQDVLYIKK